MSFNWVSVDCRSRVELCKLCKADRHWRVGVGRVRKRSERNGSSSSIVGGSGGMESGDVRG